MKLLALALCLSLCSCETRLDCNAGTYRTMGDNGQVTIKASNGHITYYHADTNVHTPVTKANWHGAIALGGEVAGTALGLSGGGQAAGAGLVAITSIVHRPTSRGTSPTQVIVTKP